MSAEYGIFNDEGCIDRGFYDKDRASAVKDDLYQDEPGAYVAEMCPDHEEQPRDFCEDCAGDELDEDSDNAFARDPR